MLFRARILLCLFCFTLFAGQVSANDIAGPELQCPSAILMEHSTGKILYEKNSHERLPLASITKVMTMLLTMEEIDAGNLTYDTIVTGSAHAKSLGGSTIFLDEGEQLSVHDLLKGVAVNSGNDAAVALGEHIAGSEEGFVARMNERAAQLGMVDTHFMNCHGLDTDNHYSTAYDIALMSRELLNHPDIHNFTTIWMDTLRNGQFTLSNTNKLIRFYQGATGLKTGSTTKAKFCISATAKRDNMHLISVTMASPSGEARVSDASTLLNHGFANYALKSITAPGENVGEVLVSKGTKPSVAIIAEQPFDYLTGKNDKTEVERRLVMDDKVKAPILAGSVAGRAEYYVNGEKIGEGNLLFAEDVARLTFWQSLCKFFTRWLGN
ncbi:MAG: D-alanyl-D-alanine carboxypeptidase [Ruminococcaceae bacterium]|nr:D-alanyl-D-alanine carboxypeptidase [Oscillospiraceae bacterium]